MHLATIDIVIVCSYFVLVVAVGLLARLGLTPNDEDYFLVGRRLTLPLFVMSLTATFYGGVLGIGEFTYLYGVSNWVTQALPYYVFAALFAWMLAGRVQRNLAMTLPDIFRERFGQAAGYVAAVFVFILASPAPYILMLATLIQLLSGWAFLVCLFAAIVVSMIYLGLGGLRSDVWTDAVEFVLMFVGMACILPFAMSKTGSLGHMFAALPEMHRTWHGGNTTQYIVVWFFVALWTFVDPSFHQRCAAAKNPQVARWGILWCILFWALFDAITTIAGLYARVALPNLDVPMLAFPRLAELVLPAGFLGLFVVGMLATIMSTSNSMMFISAQSLSRDLFWQLRKRVGENAYPTMTIGLIATSLLSVALAYALPSVVSLWYSIATVVIPALLVPTLWYYMRPHVHIAEGWVLASMLISSAVSTVWLIVSVQSGASLLGIEPMYPGLFIAIVLWAIGCFSSKKT